MTQPAPHRPRARDLTSAADVVVADIQSRVSAQNLAPGTRLGTKQDLCEHYQLAPATLGEALRVLRARGAIEVRPGPGGGIFVAEQSPLVNLAYEVMDLRRAGAAVNDFVVLLDMLDAAVIRDAAANRTAAEADALEDLLSEVAERWHESDGGVHVNWLLHRRIAELARNVVLRTFYLGLVDYVSREVSTDVTMGVSGFRADSAERLAAHRRIVAAIRSQDPDDVESAIVAHGSPHEALSGSHRTQ